MIFTVKGKNFDTKVINGENPYIIDNNTKEKPKNEKNILKAFLDKEMPDYDKVKYHSIHQLIRLVEGILRDRIVYSEDDIIKLNHFIESLPDKQIDNPSDTWAALPPSFFYCNKYDFKM